MRPSAVKGTGNDFYGQNFNKLDFTWQMSSSEDQNTKISDSLSPLDKSNQIASSLVLRVNLKVMFVMLQHRMNDSIWSACWQYAADI